MLLMLISLFSCKRDNTVTIKGDIKGLKAKWVYFARVFQLKGRPVDSAQVKNGKFEFRLRQDTAFLADLFYISYVDEKGKNQSIGVTNPYEPEKNHSLYADFVIGPGLTTITGDFSKSPGAKLEGGAQTDFYFKNSTLPILRLSQDSIKRNVQAARIKKIIEQSPDAYWAIYASRSFKYYLSHEQLKELYSIFSDKAKASYHGRQLKQFIDDQPAIANQFTNSVFLNKDTKAVNLVDSTKKLNMVIFWASWCGPCRREIPSLKRIITQFNKDDVRFVSVSVDAKKEDWLLAMKQEDMAWQQLIIPQQQFTKAQAQYNLGSIPKVYLVNNKNVVVKKIDGFDDGNEERVKTFIADYLSKN
ncbi:MAG: Thiol-disulfide isomerase or thioredoxin [Mucilaginibacter sp.]|nr:Thiol-disulfide isomerase or thioredoxin [Mucilaginibacter sp.]